MSHKKYNLQLPGALLDPSSKKEKKSTWQEIPYISGNGTFLALILKNFLYFLMFPGVKFAGKESFSSSNIKKQKPPKNLLKSLKGKLFLYFRKRKPQQNSLCFRNWLSELEKKPRALKKFLIFREIAHISGGNLQSLKVKKCSILFLIKNTNFWIKILCYNYTKALFLIL